VYVQNKMINTQKQDCYTSKTRESRNFERKKSIQFIYLGVNHYLVVLYLGKKSHHFVEKLEWKSRFSKFIESGVTTRCLHLDPGPDYSREIQLSDSDVWVPTTTLLCSIFLPVLVKAIPCIGKDLGMSTIAYASLMVEL